MFSPASNFFSNWINNSIPSMTIWLCDADRDCYQNEDELPALCVDECTSKGQVACVDSYPTQCIDKLSVCDSHIDCRNKWDESNCCGQDGFSCNNGKCIPSEWICNTQIDCPSRLDESWEICGFIHWLFYG